MIHRLRQTTSVTVSSLQTVWNATLDILRYGIERKTCVILRCELAMHNEQNVKIVMCQFVANFLSCVSAKYY